MYRLASTDCPCTFRVFINRQHVGEVFRTNDGWQYFDDRRGIVTVNAGSPSAAARHGANI